MKIRSISGLAAMAFAAAVCSTPALADPIVAGDPALAPYTLQYGDFNVVSLAFANTATGTTNYQVKSSPGQIKDFLVVGTHSGVSMYNGKIADPMTLAGADTPYATPNGAGAASYFRTGNAVSSPDPGGAGEFAGDTANSWDISISALRTYLGGQNMVFYFNLNETGTDDTLSGTDLLFYMKVTLSNSSTGAKTDFYLAGNPFDPAGSNNGKLLSIASGGPDETLAYPDLLPTDPPTFDPTDRRWSFVHGNICVNGSSFLHYGSCVSTDPAGSQTVKQNLGEDEAAFAGYNSVLSDLINNSSLYDTMSIDWRMADENNGYEQLFILAGGGGTRIPEPLTIGLFGAGLAGVALLHRRRRKA
ncbi:MAG TPA: PEP-CTERM sorting domain-containing protein [Rhizomicrobium sp.]|nr:PEP-CTERM sorting domain-containing protein [Rhizomicrobium sp.]